MILSKLQSEAVKQILDWYQKYRVGFTPTSVKELETLLSDQIEKAVEETKKENIKEVDMVKKCIYGIKGVEKINLGGKELEVITKYQAVNCLNLMEHTPLSEELSIKQGDDNEI